MYRPKSKSTKLPDMPGNIQAQTATMPAKYRATREPDKFSLSKLSDLITFGASPRASINLVLASKAKAFIDGRGYVIPEDVKYVAKDILRHRILLSYEAEAEEISSEDIIDQLLQEIPVP